MEVIIWYLIKSSAVSGIFYLIYHIAFRNESFFTLNRLYLLMSILFSYLFPFIRIDMSGFKGESGTIIHTIHTTVNQFTFIEEPPVKSDAVMTTSHSMEYWWVLLIAIVSFVFLFRFLKNTIQLVKTINANEKINQANFTLVLINQQYTFSFFRYIFISPTVWHSTNGNSIINHELSHLRHRHTYDRLFMEILLIGFWMNPFIYLYRKALEEVHEFQADADATQHSSLKSYFNLVLQQASHNHYSPLMSPFSYKLIKKRIKMVNYKSRPFKKTVFVIPVALSMLILLASAVLTEPEVKSGDQIIHTSLSITPPQQIESGILTESETKEGQFALPIKKSEIKKMSSGYGMRKHPITKKMKMHNGVDYVAPLNTNILAIGDGVVRKVNHSFEEGKGHGRFVIVDHANGYSSLYSQLNAYKVKEGQKVKQGDVIGLLGSSGISTGPHLHLEIKKDGQFIDPESVIK